MLDRPKIFVASDGLMYPEKLVPEQEHKYLVLDKLPITPYIKNIDLVQQRDPNAFTLARRNGFGGSDSSVLLGVNPYARLDDLIKQKATKHLTEEEKALKDNVAIMKGNDLEPLIIQKCARVFGMNIMKPSDMYQFKDFPYLKMNFDGVAGLPEHYFPVEIKVVTKNGERHYRPTCAVFFEGRGFFAEKDPAFVNSDNSIATKAAFYGVPPYYYTQVQQEMMALNAPYGFLCSLWESIWKLIIYKIPQDVSVQNAIKIQGFKAWQKVVALRAAKGEPDEYPVPRDGEAVGNQVNDVPQDAAENSGTAGS